MSRSNTEEIIAVLWLILASQVNDKWIKRVIYLHAGIGIFFSVAFRLI